MEPHRTASGVSGKHPAVDAGQEEEEEREEIGETAAVAAEESYFAAVLFPTCYLRRAGRSRPFLLAERVRSKVNV